MLQYLLKSIRMRGDALNPGVVNLNSAAEGVHTVNIVCPTVAHSFPAYLRFLLGLWRALPRLESQISQYKLSISE